MAKKAFNLRDSTFFLLLGLIITLMVCYGASSFFFEDDALITMQYAKNFSSGCGWSFNCNEEDFATTSLLHTFLSSIIFYATPNSASALVLIKVYESTVIVLAILAFTRMLLIMGIDRTVAALSGLALSVNDNTFVYMASGMENALNLLFLSMTLTLGYQKKYYLSGISTGVLYLVRPDSVLVGPVMAFVDFWKRQNKFQHWAINWCKAGVASLVIAVPILSMFFLTKGTPIPDSGMIKLLTAKNWGFFHEYLPTLIKNEIHWLPFCIIGICVAVRRYSPLWSPLIFSALSVIVYTIIQMPKSPWCYLPFHFGFFTLSSIGANFIITKVKKSNSGMYIPPLRMTGIVLLLLVVLFSLLKFPQTVKKISRIASKRNNINKRMGEWINQYVPKNFKVGIPNIGYIGFYSGSHLIIDTVGLITPDVAKNRGIKNYWYNTYSPEFFGDKMSYWKSRWNKNHLDYEIVSLKGRPAHENERYAIGLRRDLVNLQLRRKWKFHGKDFRTYEKTVDTDKGYRLVRLSHTLSNEIAISEDNFIASDIVIVLSQRIHGYSPLEISISLHSKSTLGNGYIAFLTKEKVSGKSGEQIIFLSQENITKSERFTPQNVNNIQLEYKFNKYYNMLPELRTIEVISFSGCKLAKKCFLGIDNL